MRDNSIDVFHHLFFDSDEYALVNNTNDQETDLSMNEDSVVESPMIQTLRNKLFSQLGDWFSFIEIKSQRNITMSLFVFFLSKIFFSSSLHQLSLSGCKSGSRINFRLACLPVGRPVRSGPVRSGPV